MKRHSQKIAETARRPSYYGSKTWRIWICIFLAAAVFAVYGQALSHRFINFDDNVYVTHNEHIKKGFSSESIVWAFTTTRASNWHPVTWLSHMLDYQLFGLNPAGHHLVNALFHTANTLLLFLVLARMTGALWQSAFVAAMFALHPLNVESVAWVSERKNVLSTFFWLLTMRAYVSYTGKNSIGGYFLALMFFALGLASKPILVTLPFVLLLLDYWPLRRLRPGKEKDAAKGEKLSRLVLEKIPFLALALASCVGTFAAQKGGGAVQSADIYPLWARVINAMVSYVEYLEKTVWPKGLAVLYPHPGTTLPFWQGAVCAALLACVTVAAVKTVRKAPYLAIGWFWYLGALIPVIGIVQVGAQAMADRYAYIPLIGIFIAIAWGLPDLLEKFRWRNKALAAAAAIIIPALAAVSWTQAGHWKNSITLFQHAIETVDSEYPNFALAHLNLGNALSEQKRNGEAIVHYKEAIRLKPDYGKAHNNLGAALAKIGRAKAAFARYKDAIKVKPKYAPSHYNLGIALSERREIQEAMASYREAIRLQPKYAKAHNNLGTILRQQGNYKEAIAHYREAVKHKPGYAEAHNNLGDTLAKLTRFDEAADSLRQAITLSPGYANAHNNLGDVLRKQGNFKDAIAHFESAVKIDSGLAAAHNSLGETLLDIRKPEEAISHYRQAIKIRPRYAGAHNNLGVALLIMRRASEAIAPFSDAIKFSPNYAEAHSNLGVALSLSGKAKEAVPHYREAIRLQPGNAEAHNNLGKTLGQLKRIEEAIVHYREAIRLKPGYPQALSGLKAALAAKTSSSGGP